MFGKSANFVKNEANVKRTPQTRGTSRNYSFVAVHCSESTNKERRGKRRDRGREREKSLGQNIFSPRKPLTLFILFLLWQNGISRLDSTCPSLPTAALLGCLVIRTS